MLRVAALGTCASNGRSSRFYDAQMKTASVKTDAVE
jgi:hypothetical protein